MSKAKRLKLAIILMDILVVKELQLFLKLINLHILGMESRLDKSTFLKSMNYERFN